MTTSTTGKPLKPYDLRTAKRWIRNAADERAVRDGCRFDEARGQFVIDFAADNLVLYEGDCAGQPLVAHDWQIEATLRTFGWVKYSDRLGRWIRRFTHVGAWVPKKNKKSPTLAWWSLYLLCADGEMGQEVYLGAKNGDQVNITVGKHVIAMLDRSPRLSEECVVNRSTRQITHLPTSSRLLPLSSGDEKTRKAKEGLNGSLCLDEMHVVDREFYGRVSRCGISRSEPLVISMSTVGDDPLSIGKERWDHGEQVNAGKIHDERFNHMSFAAPQDLTDEQLARNPAKYFKMANPAAGHTVHVDEFLDDYHRSQASIVELARLKMYRLNIWQSGEKKWLRDTDWQANEERYSAEDLAGRECDAGIDLATTRDTVALTLVFPPTDDDPVYRLLPFFWLPEARAYELRESVAYLQWGKDGFIELTPGEVCDYAFIRRRVAEIREQFAMQTLCFDPWNASHFIQELQEDGVYCEKFARAWARLVGPPKNSSGC
jgi:phage terminase large subunit-like protein